MQFASIYESSDERPVAAVLRSNGDWVRLSDIDVSFGDDLFTFIASDTRPEIGELREVINSVELDPIIGDVRFAPPYLHPPKIWGIGLNYLDHATDLSADHPEEPTRSSRRAVRSFYPSRAVASLQRANLVWSSASSATT